MQQRGNQFLVFLAIISFFSGSGCQSFRLVQKPVRFDNTRTALSLEYMDIHHGLVQQAPVIDPRMIVIHYTVIPTMEEAFEVFDRTIIPESREMIRSAGRLNVSAHYLVDRDGTIYQMLPDTIFARHVIGLNYCAIGIENVGNGDTLPLTKQQLKANARLIRKLAGKHEITYLIGHSEYQSFIGHPLWKESDPDYLTMKSDPGDEFMMMLRKKVKPLKLKGPPKT